MSGPLRWVALFSGQGGQRAEPVAQMSATLPDELRDAWQRALADAGVAVDHLDDATLARNRVAQPTLVALELAAFARIAASAPPVLVAGYSVGEVAACAAAGGMTSVDAIDIAATRARLMDEAVSVPCALAAVLGLGERDVAALCVRTGVAIAIRNGTRHFVVGGPSTSLAAFIEQASAAGATRACALAVHTPAHTPWLASAVPRFADALRPRVRARLRVPSLAAIDASRVRTGDEAVAALSRQLATALDWAACMDVVAEAQPDAVVEIGPGNALARMFADAVPDIPVRALAEFKDPAAATAWMERQRRAV